MSPLGRFLADWLAGKPGHFEGDTFDACLKTAFDASKAARYVSQDDFAEGLRRAGYEPQERTRHGDGGGKSYWIICLPERGIGSR